MHIPNTFSVLSWNRSEQEALNLPKTKMRFDRVGKMASFEKEFGSKSTPVNALALGQMPFHRDNAQLAFGRYSVKQTKLDDGQALAGTGALVFEGELLELPAWH